MVIVPTPTKLREADLNDHFVAGVDLVCTSLDGSGPGDRTVRRATPFPLHRQHLEIRITRSQLELQPTHPTL